MVRLLCVMSFYSPCLSIDCFGMIRFSITPTIAARPIPPKVTGPMCISAPPIPRVRISDEITRFLVLPMSTLFFTRVFTPTEAIVPKSRSMMPPRTALGMVFNNALILPTTENSIPNTPAILNTAGSEIFVRETAPVTTDK